MIDLSINKDVFVNDFGVNAIFEINPSIKCNVEKGLENIYFPNNDELFASIKIGDYFIRLENAGEVHLGFNKKAIDKKGIEAYDLLNNNWFIISMWERVIINDGRKKELFINDYPIRQFPKAYEDLKLEFIKYANILYKESDLNLYL